MLFPGDLTEEEEDFFLEEILGESVMPTSSPTQHEIGPSDPHHTWIKRMEIDFRI